MLTMVRSGDTMFHEAARGTYDVAVCMYHDRALIPMKTLDFDNGVNVSVGLPFVRTSPDHGTAYNIAGTTATNPTSQYRPSEWLRNRGMPAKNWEQLKLCLTPRPFPPAAASATRLWPVAT